jgi:metallophosphoesterase (TIGR00282 family)
VPDTLNVLFIGDIIGEPGLKAAEAYIKNLIHDHKIQFVIANGENLTLGKGIIEKDAKKAFDMGINVLTGGNHTFSKMQSNKYISEEVRILRPCNHHDDVYGRGYMIYPVSLDGSILKLAVINSLGRVYISTLNCPFRVTSRIVENVSRETNLIIVDFHGEATAEKIAFGWYMDGKVSAVIGTHTHVQTADERILPNGTAYITDVGMTGAFDGVIGSKKEFSINRFVYQTPQKQEVATDDLRLSAVVINIDTQTGKAVKIYRLFIPEFKQ